MAKTVGLPTAMAAKMLLDGKFHSHQGWAWLLFTFKCQCLQIMEMSHLGEYLAGGHTGERRA
jgi:hypothetical protein